MRSGSRECFGSMIGLLPAVRSRRHARGNSQSRKAFTVRRAARVRQRLECVSQFLSGRRPAGGLWARHIKGILREACHEPDCSVRSRATGARDFMDHHGLVREASGHGPSSFTPSFKRPACAGAAPSGRVALGRPSMGQMRSTSNVGLFDFGDCRPPAPRLAARLVISGALRILGTAHAKGERRCLGRHREPRV
jgi:hypothetical protein